VAVLGTPFLFVGIAVVMGVGVAVFSVLGRIPYAGPILYGVAFAAVFGMGFVAAVSVLLMSLVSFSYIPAMADEQLSPVQAAARILGLLRRHLVRYLGHFLLAAVCAFLLHALLQTLLALTMGLIAWLGGELMGANCSATFLAMPTGLFGGVYFVLPDSAQAWFSPSSGSAWYFDVGGWLVGLSLMAGLSLVMSFVLVYFQAAGVVNYHLLVQRDEEDA
jgi:hypothetical protein